MERTRPRIGIVCGSASFGGAELLLVRLGGWLVTRGRGVAYLVARGTVLADRLRATGADVETFRPRLRHADLPAAAAFAAFVRRRDVGAIVLGSADDLRVAALARTAFRCRAPLAYVQQMQFGAPKRDRYHARLHRHVGLWIAPLPGLAEQTRRWTRIPAERIRVVPHGVELERFGGGLPEKRTARAALGLPIECTVIGNVGRLDAGKAQIVLVEAAALLRARDCDVHVLLVGEDTRGERQEYRERLLRAATEHGVADRVHLRPFRDDVETAFAAMDVFALTSLSETFGLVTVEALAAGLPVVGTDSAGTPEIVRNGSTGVLVPPGDAGALAAALEKLLRDPDCARALGHAARTDAAARFSHDRMCDRYEEILDELAGNSSR